MTTIRIMRAMQIAACAAALSVTGLASGGASASGSPFDIKCFDLLNAGVLDPASHNANGYFTGAPASGNWSLSTSTTTATLPPNGVICLKSLTGTTSSSNGIMEFTRNEDNTPVTILVEESVNINRHTIRLNGGSPTNYFSVGLSRLGGLPGPGGFHGGSCDFRLTNARTTGEGFGPGGGKGHHGLTGGGGGAGPTRSGGYGFIEAPHIGGAGGVAAASFTWRIPHGGSGGGCGANLSGAAFGGGGGGGAITIAAGQLISVGNTSGVGGIEARGGASTGGGGGGGGNVRLIAPTIDGLAAIDVRGSNGGACALTGTRGGCGGNGLVKLEGVTVGGLFINNSTALNGLESIKYGTAQPAYLTANLTPTIEVVNVRATFDGEVHDQAPPAVDLAEHPHRVPGVHLRDGQTLTVTVRTMHVPATATVNLRMNAIDPNPGASTENITVQASNPTATGTPNQREWTATVTVPLGAKLGSIEAWVPNVCTPGTSNCPSVN